jgi:hypothetical protein
MKQTLSIMAFAATMLFFSCKKGEDGAPGKTGTANVRYSEWFTPATYTKDTIFGIWGFYNVKQAPGITQQVLDSGTVFTFAKLKGYNTLIWPAEQVGQLPISLTYVQGGTQTDTWSAAASIGSLKIRFVNDHNIYNTIANAHQFRYIIIPGGLPGGRTIPLSYEEICRKYNVPE